MSTAVESLVTARDARAVHGLSPRELRDAPSVVRKGRKYYRLEEIERLTEKYRQTIRARRVSKARKRLRQEQRDEQRAMEDWYRDSNLSDERRAELQERFPDWRNALPVAANVMFNLNRYAKRISKNDKIYDLKNEFVQLLYENGYCTRCAEHRRLFSAKECYSCGGFGCESCDDTGEYESAAEVIEIAFHFQIGDIEYCWHQPRDTIKFEFQTTGEPERAPDTTRKLLTMGIVQMFRDADIIRFVLDSAGRV